eukprot:7155813-Prymnesium_polylepis.1
MMCSPEHLVRLLSNSFWPSTPLVALSSCILLEPTTPRAKHMSWLSGLCPPHTSQYIQFALAVCTLEELVENRLTQNRYKQAFFWTWMRTRDLLDREPGAHPGPADAPGH